MTPAEIAELREFISGEFGRVHARLDRVDQRLDSIDGRLDSMEGRLSVLTARVDERYDEQLRFEKLVGRHFNDVLTRLRKVEILGKARDHDFKAFGESLESVDRRLEAFREDVSERFDRVDYRLGHLEVA